MWLWWKRVLVVASILATILMGTVPAWAAAPAPPGPFKAKAALLMDANSGKVLWSLNPDRELPMASVTKLMTLYLAIRALQKGQIKMNELVPVTEDAYRVNGSQIWLEPGERLTVNQMLKAIAVGSANDAAFALGEFISGSEPAFVQLMNQTAAKFGMRHTQFQNPHGLSVPNHYTTAADLAQLAERAVRMPLLLHYTKMWEDRSIRNGKGGTLWLINQNRLLKQYPGTDGLKTGYTNEAGFCLVATARRQDSRMIAIILGEPTSSDRFQEAAGLMSWGFDHFKTVVLARAGQSFGNVSVSRGSARFVQAVAPRLVAVTIAATDAKPPTAQAELETQLSAPVQKGQTIGRLIVKREGETMETIPLTASASVRAIALPETVWHFFWRIIG